MTKYRITYTAGTENPEGRRYEFSEIREYKTEEPQDVIRLFTEEKRYAKIVKVISLVKVLCLIFMYF